MYTRYGSLICLFLACALVAGCQGASPAPEAAPRPSTGSAASTAAAFSIHLNDQADRLLVSIEDIVAYSWKSHEITLTPAAIERINAIRFPAGGVPFVVQVGPEPIYSGRFVPLFSSSSFDGVVIPVPLMKDTAMSIRLGYPSEEFFTGSDSRSDSRIREALEMAGKLN